MKMLAKLLTFWIPVKRWRKQARNFLQNLSIQQIVLHYYLLQKNIVCIASVDGMGDYIYLFGYMKEFKKIHNIKKLIFIARTKHQKFLAEKISAFDKVILYKNFDVLSVTSHSKYNSEKLFVGNFFQPEIYQNIPDNNCSALDGLKYLLDIDKNTKLELDELKYEDSDKKKKIEKELSHFPKGKTVLISTQSVSCPTKIQDNFWLKIADFLKTNGYEVLFNSQEKTFYGYPTIYPSKEDLKYYTDYFGCFVSLRSGITDLIATTSTAKNIVIYPTQFPSAEIRNILVSAYGPFDGNVAEFIFEKWSLRKIRYNTFEAFDTNLNLNDMLNYISRDEI